MDRIVAADVAQRRRVHPVTGQRLVYIVRAPTVGHQVRAVAPDELVEVRWLDRGVVAPRRSPCRLSVRLPVRVPVMAGAVPVLQAAPVAPDVRDTL